MEKEKPFENHASANREGARHGVSGGEIWMGTDWAGAGIR